MAVFYVLPPRSTLGDALARFLRAYFPGLAITGAAAAELIDALLEKEPAYFVHREDLTGSEVASALRDGFGAETGDQVVLVEMGARLSEPQVSILSVTDSSPARIAA